MDCAGVLCCAWVWPGRETWWQQDGGTCQHRQYFRLEFCLGAWPRRTTHRRSALQNRLTALRGHECARQVTHETSMPSLRRTNRFQPSLGSVTTSAAGTLPAPNTVCSSTTEDWSVGQTARRDQKERQHSKDASYQIRIHATSYQTKVKTEASQGDQSTPRALCHAFDDRGFG